MTSTCTKPPRHATAEFVVTRDPWLRRNAAAIPKVTGVETLEPEDF
jgi:hypothetical protein